MKIYVDSQWRICELRSTTNASLLEIEVDRSDLGHWCDVALLGFCYKLFYKTDSDGKPILDGDGNKIVMTRSVYPGIDLNIIQSIQHLYEQEQEYITTLQLSLTEQYETNLALSGEVTNTQLAITELYEGLGV